jgi:hypothetical protein
LPPEATYEVKVDGDNILIRKQKRITKRINSIVIHIVFAAKSTQFTNVSNYPLGLFVIILYTVQYLPVSNIGTIMTDITDIIMIIKK